MNLTRDRARSIGWGIILGVVVALTVALTFRVNAVKSQVRLAERQIVAVERDKMLLETEFETRANQQQLKALNDVDFGYQAPTASQYMENERQLASLGRPRGPNAPEPIRVASAADTSGGGIPAMVPSLATKAVAADVPASGVPKPVDAAGLNARLSRNEAHAAKSPEADPE